MRSDDSVSILQAEEEGERRGKEPNVEVKPYSGWTFIVGQLL